MKYILLKRRNINYTKEIEAREKYLYEVFKLWYVKTQETSDYIVLQSFPYDTLNNVMFLIGHCDAIKDYLSSNSFFENTIVLISCYYKELGIVLKKISNKNILYSLLNKNIMTEMYDGREYNFDFAEISKSEILLYNFRNESLDKKLEKCFIKWR